MTRDYFGVPRNAEKALERADSEHQRTVAKQAAEAVSSHLPSGVPEVDAAAAAVRSGQPLSRDEFAALRAVATGFAERVDPLRAQNGHAAAAAARQHHLIAVNVLECAADPDMTSERALRSLSTAFMVLSKDKAATDALVGYLKRLG